MLARFNGNVVPFADDATSTNRTVFGGTTQSDNIDDNLNEDFKKGWEIVGLNDNPTREDFNAMGYTLGALTSYLYEMGISEWNASQNYRIGSRVIGSDGKIYKALTGTIGTPNVNHNPTSDNTNWEWEFKSITDYSALTAKTTPVDTDLIPLSDSAASFGLKKLSWANLKANLNTGFKNYIINGKKVINQRNLTSTDNSYNQDRWYKAGNNWFQGIEGDNNLISGKKYTLSWVGNATASYYVGTATSATINAQTFTSIANGGNFTLTISAGQNLWIKFSSDSIGSTFNFVQLEEGNIATPFEQRPIGLELSLCQRYYERIMFNISGTTPFTNGYVGGQSQYSVTKRVFPTINYGNVIQNDNIYAIYNDPQLIGYRIWGQCVANAQVTYVAYGYASAEL